MPQPETLLGSADRRYHNIGEGAFDVNNPASQEANALIVVDRILEPQTVPHFLEFLGHGRLPSGKQSNRQELLDADDISLFTRPSQEWASDRLPKQSKSMVDLMMIAIGSHEDQSDLRLVTKPVHATKSRVWEGISPMSDARWVENNLDDPRNHDLAVQHLSNVIAAFDYLNDPQVQTGLKGTYNKIFNHFRVFNAPFKSVRQSRDLSAVDVPAKWEEFFEDHLTSMCQRAHEWVQRHVTLLQDRVLKAIESHEHDAESHPAPPPFDAVQWKLTNRFHDLLEISVRADVRIWIPMHGYHGYTPPPGDFWIEPDLWSSDVDRRSAVFHRQMKLLSRADPSFLSVNSVLPANHPLNIHVSCDSQRSAQAYIRSKQRGEAIKLGPEPWIAHLAALADPSNPRASELNEHFGFVIYRLTHAQSDEEWQEFQNRLDADIRSWTSGQKAAHLIDHKWELHWIDGKDEDVPENDIDSAIAHFDHFREADSNQRLFDCDFVQSSIFLAVDNASFASYMQDSKSGSKSGTEPLSGVQGAIVSPDRGSTASFEATLEPVQWAAVETERACLDRGEPPSMRFVYAVDPDFDVLNPGEHAEESPDFTGRMRILGSLIVADLYAMYVAQTQGLFELWPLAMRNPGQVYMGTVVRGEEEAWKVITPLKKPEPAAWPTWIKEVVEGLASKQASVLNTGSEGANELSVAVGKRSREEEEEEEEVKENSEKQD